MEINYLYNQVLGSQTYYKLFFYQCSYIDRRLFFKYLTPLMTVMYIDSVVIQNIVQVQPSFIL